MEANFELIVQPKDPYLGIVSDDVDNPEFKFPDDKGKLKVGIKPIGFRGRGHPWSRRNRKRCLDLEEQLVKELGRDKWAISLKLKMNAEELLIDMNDINEELKVVSFDVLVEGEVLDKLHSLMLYGLERSGRLELSLEGTLDNLDVNEPVGAEDENNYLISWDGSFSAELLPQRDGNSPFCCKYAATNVKLMNETDNGDHAMLLPHADIGKWRLSSPRLIVRGTSSDFDNELVLGYPGIIGHYKRLLEDGTRADLQIIGLDGVIVPCHSCVLAVRSPVVAAKFSGRFENDVKKSTIDLRESSKEEISAFLEFLYYGGTEKALQSPTVAMGVFHIGQYLLVPEVEQTMEEILLTRPAHLFSVDAGLELYHLGRTYDKIGLQRKAIDVLGIWTTKEVKASELFRIILPSVTLRKEFRNCRKKF